MNLFSGAIRTTKNKKLNAQIKKLKVSKLTRKIYPDFGLNVNSISSSSLFDDSVIFFSTGFTEPLDGVVEPECGLNCPSLVLTCLTALPVTGLDTLPVDITDELGECNNFF